MKRAAIWGLVAGAGLVTMGLALFWVTRDSGEHWLKVETSDDKTLSHRFEMAPRLALRPRKVQDVADSLGFKRAQEAQEVAVALAERVAAGFMPSRWRETCAAEYPPQLCEAVVDYFGVVLKRSPKPSGSPSARVNARFVPAQVDKLQRADFAALRRSAPPKMKMSELTKLANAALKTTACPRSLSLVLARKFEEELPNPAAWPLMLKLDDHGLGCLEASDPSAEFLLLRGGLFKYAREEWDAAEKYLLKAAEVEDPDEDYRSLYWLARLYREQGRDEDARRMRERLYAKHPLSWYTIQSHVETGGDPLARLTSSPNYADLYESGDAMTDRRIAWLHLLMSLPNAGFSVRKYGEFVIRNLPRDVNPSVVQYLARLFSHTAFYRLQILILSQLSASRPEHVTAESLRLLYPKPFVEEISVKAPEVDTALLLGLARQESGFDPKARSRANAQGLLQILPSTAYSVKKKTKTELYDYAHNIEVGSKYLLTLIQRFDGSVERALGGYNAGPGNVRKWERRYAWFVNDPLLFVDLIPFRETRDYAPSILRNAYWYHRLFPGFTENLGKGSVTSLSLRKALNLPVAN